MDTATIPPVAVASIMLTAMIDGTAWKGMMWYSLGNITPRLCDARKAHDHKETPACYVHLHCKLLVEPQLKANLCT